MKDENKTKSELVKELKALRQRIAEFKRSETEHKNVEKSLRESEEYYRRITEAVTDYICTVRVKEGHPVETTHSKTSVTVTGYKPEEFTADPNLWIRMVAEEDRAAVLGQARCILSGQAKPLEHRIVRKDGTIRWVRNIPVPHYDARGKLLSYDGVIRDITGRKKAEEKINYERYLLNTLMDNIPDSIYFKDNKSHFVRVNKAEADFFGLSDSSQAIGKTDYDFFTKEHAEQAFKDEMEVMRTVKPLISKEEKVTFQDGREKWFSTTKMPLKDEDGKIIGTFGISRDITEKKNIGEKLRESEEKLRSFMESATASFSLWDSELNLVEINKASMVLFPPGTKKEDILGKGILDIIPDIKETGRYDKFMKVIKTGKPFFINDIVPHPKFGDIHLALKAFKVSSGLGLIATDITELKRAEEALSKERNLLRTLIDNLPEFVYFKDVESHFVISNVVCLRAMGVTTQDEVVGKTSFDFYPQELATQYYADEQEVMRTGKPQINKEEPFIYKATGIRRLFSTSIVPLSDNHGKIVGLVGVSRDITKRKQLEEQLQIRQRMDSLGTLAGGIAHDFNNLLAGIMGYLDILININSEGFSETQREYIENALKSCTRAADLVKQFQSLSKGTFSKKTAIDLYEASNEVFSLLEKTTDKLINKKIDLKPGEFYVTANASELHQVLLNLGTNAVKAIEERGIKRKDYISIRAKEYVITGKDKTGLTEGKYVHIFFKDNGIGMADEIRKKAFDPLFTTGDKSAQKGQGLGLAMVYNIITRNHNGYIDIESVKGKGTTIHIYLPIAKPQEQTESEVMGVVGGNETVLIVEDEAMICTLAETVLKNYGYRVLTALNGKEGLDIYAENKDSIDLVLLDLTMPEMSGQMVFEEILKINHDVKVIISSGHSQEDTREAICSKAKAYVSKPYRTTDLAQTVRTVLDL